MIEWQVFDDGPGFSPSARAGVVRTVPFVTRDVGARPHDVPSDRRGPRRRVHRSTTTAATARRSGSRCRVRDDQTSVVVIEDHQGPAGGADGCVPGAWAPGRVRRRNGRRGVDASSTTIDPDLIVLDLGLPDIDGLVLCKHLRARTTCPIIVVTADADERRVVEAPRRRRRRLRDQAVQHVGAARPCPRRVAPSDVQRRSGASTSRCWPLAIIRLDLSGYQLMVADEVDRLEDHASSSSWRSSCATSDKVVTYAALDRALGTNRSESTSATRGGSRSARSASSSVSARGDRSSTPNCASATGWSYPTNRARSGGSSSGAGFASTRLLARVSRPTMTRIGPATSRISSHPP